MPETPDYEDIRDAVARLCAQYPGEYWRKLDRERAYRPILGGPCGGRTFPTA